MIHQANYLLDQHLIAMERAFVEGGGYRETLHTARIVQRKKDQTDPSNPTDPQKATAPNCPDCEHPMAIRTAKTGSKTGAQFWGCTAYPNCKKTLPV